MVRFYLIVFLFGLSQNVVAQKKQYTFGLGTGFNFLQSRDQAASPLVYQGYGLPVALRGAIKDKMFWHQLEFNMISSNLTNAYPMRSGADSQLNSWQRMIMDYALMYRLKSSNTIDQFIGGALRSFLFFREYDYLDGYSWESVNAFRFNYWVVYRLNRHHFKAGVSLPLAAYLHRPQYTVDENFLEDLFKKQGIFKYGCFSLPLQEFFYYQVDLTYSYRLTRRLFAEWTLNFEQYQVNYPWKSKSNSFELLVYITYQF